MSDFVSKKRQEEVASSSSTKGKNIAKRTKMDSRLPIGADSKSDIEKTTISKTARELLELSTELALGALKRLIDGEVPDPTAKNYQPNSVGWPPAIYTPEGCILVQKPPATVSDITIIALIYIWIREE